MKILDLDMDYFMENIATGIASMKNNIDDICNINGWLYHRIRMSIWK